MVPSVVFVPVFVQVIKIEKKPHMKLFLFLSQDKK